jgi:hypothetical protein
MIECLVRSAARETSRPIERPGIEASKEESTSEPTQARGLPAMQVESPIYAGKDAPFQALALVDPLESFHDVNAFREKAAHLYASVCQRTEAALKNE